MILEVKNHSDPPPDLSYWVFYRPECVFIVKKFFFISINTIYCCKTEQKIIKKLGLKMDW